MDAAAMVARCNECGARVDDLLCTFCGTLTRAVDTVDAQVQALRELHGILRGADTRQQIKLLTAGYVPSHRAVLIEAGLQALPFIRDGEADDLSDAAVRRLEAIATRLRIAGDEPDAQRALAQFDERLARFRKADRNLNVAALLVVLALVGLAAWGVVVLLRR